MEKFWKIVTEKEILSPGDLQSRLNIDRVVTALLGQRNILNYDAAKTFFRPDLKQLHDPFMMKGMKAAIDRIELAIAKNEKVLIFGDYDVDGTTAVSLVYSFFKEHISNIGYYIPDRYKEGYGISLQGIDFAELNDFSLVIALDCGIKANDKIDYANKKNVDFIICDHHLPGADLPAAVAILDPKQEDCPYPYKELSGAGIGFKLIEAYSIFKNLPREKCFEYLDLVVTSIAADIVPITGENRVLAYYGLEKINTRPRPGIKALLNINQLKGPVTITTLVFTLGPRINAAGRIEHGSKAVELLSCSDESLADELAKAINETNTQRRDLDLGITTEAFSLLDNDPDINNKRSTVLFSEHWHKGVIGIVASRLIEKYYRPTIILTESDGKITGSARSVREYDVYSAIEKCGDLLDQFGGHKFAAGLTLKKENVEAFKTKFEEVVSGSITKEQLTPKIEIDAEIEFHEITDKFLRILKQFAPHGPENMTPLFCARSVFETGWGQVFGNNHLKMELFQKSNPTIRYQAIAYDKGDYIHFFQRKTPMDIVFKIQENEYKGVTTVQLLIEDLKVSGQ
ncbi:MAG TPA: single-stranded-DNA-specific exonuclease RecJ [Bacteroidia bacterium]|nr:single-stranded-DNA-specific exonuclease RecJ [Bacteroidia bacterium]